MGKGSAFSNITARLSARPPSKKITPTHPLVPACLFLPLLIVRHNTDMENISNTRGKGYCLLYLFMGIFFFVALVLMLYYRNFVMEFPK